MMINIKTAYSIKLLVHICHTTQCYILADHNLQHILNLWQRFICYIATVLDTIKEFFYLIFIHLLTCVYIYLFIYLFIYQLFLCLFISKVSGNIWDETWKLHWTWVITTRLPRSDTLVVLASIFKISDKSQDWSQNHRN
jgi:hypothetical protein